MVKSKETDKFNVNSISANSPIGYTWETDLKYPDELHDLHNGYTLAPEKIEISNNMM